MMLMFFFFKQKTAYEMRISDWSSDVFSSDLTDPRSSNPNEADDDCQDLPLRCERAPANRLPASPVPGRAGRCMRAARGLLAAQLGRASCRDECVRTCSSRRSTYQ